MRLIRGDDATISFTITDADGAPADITSSTFRFTVKDSLSAADDAAILALSTSGGDITIDDAEAGQLHVDISSDEWTDYAYTEIKQFFWDLQEVQSGGAVVTVAGTALGDGYCKVMPDVTLTGN